MIANSKIFKEHIDFPLDWSSAFQHLKDFNVQRHDDVNERINNPTGFLFNFDLVNYCVIKRYLRWRTIFFDKESWFYIKIKIKHKITESLCPVCLELCFEYQLNALNASNSSISIVLVKKSRKVFMRNL